jgi:hypothetical protein
MNRSLHLLAAVLVSSWAGAACSFQHSGPTSPTVPAVTVTSGASTASLLGVWTSEGASARTSSVVMRPNADAPPTCTNWTWNITNQTSSEVDGNFTATCLSAFALGGQAVGTLTSANGVTITATGSGSAPNVAGSCDFGLTAQGTFDGDTLQATYTAHTCLGNFSGSERLRRNAIPGLPGPAPAPPPPPPPPPPPDPPSQPPHEAWEDCGALSDKGDLVSCVHDWVNPGSSGTLAFEVTKRVAWLLRGEGAGLLIKDGGENIISWQGHSFSISRICYPDGHIYKVISDAGDGGTNGATWADNGFVDPGLYLAAIDPHLQ